MRRLTIVALFVAAGAPAGGFAPAATFDCLKANSDIALLLAATNKGPDAVPKSTKLYWSYTTDAKVTKSGTFTTDAVVKAGEKVGIYTGSAWQTPIASCRVSLTAPRRAVTTTPKL